MITKKNLSILCLLTIFFLNGNFDLSFAKPIVLRAGSTWEESLLWNDGLRIFAEKVEKESNGEIKIEFVGGPETFPTFEAIEFLRNGVIDVFNTAAPFYTSKLPEIFTLNLTEKTPAEERENGYFEKINELHKRKLNAVYLGRISNSQYVFCFKKRLENSDFSGLKMRGIPVFNQLITALNGSPIIISPPELYTAIEKGIVDGYGWPQVGHVERKFYEVAKYHIDHPFYRVPCMLLVNLNTWNSLSLDHRKLIERIMPIVEKESCAKHNESVLKERKELENLGVQFVSWPPEEAEKFNDTAIKTAVKEAERLSPNAVDLIKLIR